MERKEIRVYAADDIPFIFLSINSCFLANVSIHRNPICKTLLDIRKTLERRFAYLK